MQSFSGLEGTGTKSTQYGGDSRGKIAGSNQCLIKVDCSWLLLLQLLLSLIPNLKT